MKEKKEKQKATKRKTKRKTKTKINKTKQKRTKENKTKQNFSKFQKKIKSKKIVCVAPDVGGTERARALGKLLDVGLAIVDKRRPKPGQSKVMNISAMDFLPIVLAEQKTSQSFYLSA